MYPTGIHHDDSENIDINYFFQKNLKEIENMKLDEI